MKKFATVGTRSLSFDRSGFPNFWCSTATLVNTRLSNHQRSMNSSKHIRLTMIVDYVFHITHDLGIPALGHAGLLVDGLCILLENSCRLGVEDERDC